MAMATITTGTITATMRSRITTARIGNAVSHCG
jgi:hypothetical protein